MPSPVPFRKVRKLLEDAGWMLVRIKGSHHVFQRPGHGTFSVPVHGGKVKAHYAKIAEKLAAETREEEQDGGR
ncbi:MAG: type II toxin-antitoxin system HicA family toxin [Planctomycetota bacterium]